LNVAVSMAALGVILTLPSGPLRTVSGLFIVFVGPGLGLSMLLVPRQAFGAIEHAVVAFALSCSAAAGVGLTLHVLSVGLSPAAWSAGLAAVAVVCSLLAAPRRPSRLPRVADGRRPTRRCAPFGLAALAITIAAVGLSVDSSRDLERRSSRTSLWLLAGTPGPRGTPVEVGVDTPEGSRQALTLTISVGGRRLTTWRVLSDPGPTSSRRIVWVPSERSDTVTAILVGADAATPLRRRVSLSPTRTRSLGADETARRFYALLGQRRFEAMYELVGDEFRERAPLQAYAARRKSVLDVDVRSVSTRRSSPDAAQTEVDVRIVSQRGSERCTGALELSRTDQGNWAIDPGSVACRAER